MRVVSRCRIDHDNSGWFSMAMLLLNYSLLTMSDWLGVRNCVVQHRTGSSNPCSYRDSKGKSLLESLTDCGWLPEL